MKPSHFSRWFMTAAAAALLPNTMQTAAAHGMNGGHGGMWMGSHSFGGRGFGHFDHRQDFHFRHPDGDRFFFHHHDRFFFAFDFAAFGFPWWYPYPYPYSYDFPYPYPYPYYGYSSNDGPEYDYRYWYALAMSVQSELARRGYYHGAIDGMIGADSRQAIRGFQAAKGLPITGRIDPKLLKTLGVNYRSA